MIRNFLRRITVLSFSLILAVTTCTIQTGTVSAGESDSGHQIKNIIYMIPDGAGFPVYNVAKEVKKAGGLQFAYSDSFTGTVPTGKDMYLDDYLVGACITRSGNSSVTDSAAASTALASGKKTNNKYLGLDPSLKPIANILELAQLEGKMTGMVVTSFSYDATPGGFSVHVKDREMPEEIIKQMAHSDIDIILGGGTDYKLTDGENIVKGGGYVTVSTEQELRAEIDSYKSGSGKKIWGTMNKNEHHLPYDYMYGKVYDGIDDSGNITPTLAEMTELSIDMLDKSDKGFFLMVEGSKVDYACHAGNLLDASSEYIAFDEAFKVALDYAKGRNDTMIVVVPDHNTGLMVTPQDKKDSSGDNRPTMHDVVNKIQAGSSAIVKDLSGLEWAASEPKYPHTGMNVPVFMYIPEGVEKMNGLSERGIKEKDTSEYIIDNTDIAPYLASLISDRTLEYATKELFVPVSGMKNTGRYKNGKFVFNDGTICVADSDVAKLQGDTEFDMGGEICLYQNNIFYAPKKLLDKIGIEYNIHAEEKLEGKGTKKNPYIIENENNFLFFTNSLKKGSDYDKKYIKQTKDIDMSDVAEYTGIGKEAVFKGYYDGQGHTVNVSVKRKSKNGLAVFPDTCGTIINLGTTGSIENTDANGVCAGIARSIRSGGRIINCWSTMKLKARKDAGGIIWAVKPKGKAVNCYYKGKIVCKNNYGIGMKMSGSRIKNCYYNMSKGSSALADTGKMTGGKKSTKFGAGTLNKYIKDVTEITRPEEKLCKFENVKGREFTFAGNYAKLKQLYYKYTDNNGIVKRVKIRPFDSNSTGYQVQLEGDVGVGDVITVYGVAYGDKDIYTVTQGKACVNEYGFATGNTTVSGRTSTKDYVTSSSETYAVNFTVQAPEN